MSSSTHMHVPNVPIHVSARRGLTRHYQTLPLKNWVWELVFLTLTLGYHIIHHNPSGPYPLNSTSRTFACHTHTHTHASVRNHSPHYHKRHTHTPLCVITLHITTNATHTSVRNHSPHYHKRHTHTSVRNHSPHYHKRHTHTSVPHTHLCA